MSDQAIKYKKLHKELNFKSMSLAELQKLPPHNGILNFKISETSFMILNILNDDSSAIKYFWKDSHDLESLNLWYNISKSEGLFIDVGAHTGLYTLSAIKANHANHVICFEPYFMNLSRLITNLRLNSFSNKASTVLGAVSNFDGKSNFSISTEKSYMSKGGKIDNNGFEVNVFQLDTLYLNKLNKKLKGIKIDTEGEDFKVLIGAKNLIKEYKPEIIIEVREENKNDIENFFKENSYKVFDVLNLNKELKLTNHKIKNVMNLYATASY